MTTTAPSPFRLRIPTTLSLASTFCGDAVEGTSPASGRTFELRVDHFDHVSKCPLWWHLRDSHDYDARMIRLDSRAAQLHRSMHVFQRVGFCDIDLAGDTQSAILSADPSGAFEIAVRYRLHRDAAFAAWCTLFIDETSRGIETLLLTDEVAALETEIGGDLDQSGVRVIRSEVDRLLGDQLLRIRC